MLFLNLNDIVIIAVNGVTYGCTIHDISKSDEIHLLERYVLHDGGHM